MSEAELPGGSGAESRIGSYRLIEPLGSGGMSSVYRAVHAQTGHEVAVKVLPRSLARNPTLLQRFLREVRSAEALEHPNIVAIYDHGQDRGRHYLVLEYVPGGDIHDRVQSDGPLEISQAITVVREAAKGLKFAAERGVIHRDVKPANLLMSPEGQVKIVDLGLALKAEADDERVTRHGTTVGTVDYMAPEQARDSRAAGVASDLYSLGCTFYYMLTGSPPFPGGVLTERLKRHALEPPPDVRQHRPEVSEALARLLQTMMAKRPQERFASYDQLIAALDALPTTTGDGGGGPLMALIDDEDDDVLAPEDVPLVALIDEDDEDIPARPSALPSLAPPTVNLADLDPLGKGAGPFDPPDFAPPSEVGLDRPPAFWLDEEPASEEEAPGASVPPRGPGSATPPMPWIMTAALGVMAVALLGVVTIFLVLRRPVTFPERAERADESGLDRDGLGGPVARPDWIGIELADPAPAEDEPDEPPSPAESVPPPRPRVPEPPSERVAQFLPDWARAALPTVVEGPFVTVRRVPEVTDDAHVTSLRRAFDRIGGTVELADTGPLFLDDGRIAGKERLVRARPGYRPIVAFEAPTLDYLREQSSVFLFNGDRLILEGLDLIVNVDDLPRNHRALFLCRDGTELVLRDCSITVVNPSGRSFALVQIGDARAPEAPPAKVRLERTFVRSPALTAFQFVGASGEVAVSDSVLLCGRQPVVKSLGPSAEPRHLYLLGSLVAGSSALLDVTEASSSDRVAVRALGCVIARIEGSEPGGANLIVGRDLGVAAVDWQGDFNRFTGWDAWLATPNGSVTGLDEARALWPGTDAESREASQPWPASLSLSEALPDDLRPLAEEMAARLDQVAVPSAFLWEKTLGRLARQAVAGLEVPPTSVETLRPVFETVEGATVRLPGALGQPLPPASIASSPVHELIFDTSAAPWAGDLGRFLREQLPDEARWVRVRVRGTGHRTITPVQIPEGVALEVLVESDPSTSGNETLSWMPEAGLDAEALIDVRGADLTIRGARFLWDGALASNLEHLVRVEDGRLLLERCVVSASGPRDIAGGALVALRSSRDEPLPARPGPFAAEADRLVARLVDCVLVTEGDAVTAELGRGVVSLENCAVAAGGTALDLRPGPGARAERFEVDLWLDRCTLAAEENFVTLGPWLGPAGGPDRPWLILTRSSVFLDAFARVPRRTVLFRTDPEALAQGTVLWQSDDDVFDVAHFTAAGGAAPSPTPRPSLRVQWVGLWGRSHVHNVSGPPNPGVRLLVDRLQPGQVALGDLALDLTPAPGRSSTEVGADFQRLPVAPTVASPGASERPPR